MVYANTIELSALASNESMGSSHVTLHTGTYKHITNVAFNVLWKTTMYARKLPKSINILCSFRTIWTENRWLNIIGDFPF